MKCGRVRWSVWVRDYQLLLFIVGLIVWAMGRVMAYGLQLQQEQDLVI